MPCVPTAIGLPSLQSPLHARPDVCRIGFTRRCGSHTIAQAPKARSENAGSPNGKPEHANDPSAKAWTIATDAFPGPWHVWLECHAGLIPYKSTSSGGERHISRGAKGTRNLATTAQVEPVHGRAHPAETQSPWAGRHCLIIALDNMHYVCILAIWISNSIQPRHGPTFANMA